MYFWCFLIFVFKNSFNRFLDTLMNMECGHLREIFVFSQFFRRSKINICEVKLLFSLLFH